MQTSIEIIKNRSDIGAGTRGADLGIDAMEIAAINKGSDFFHRYPFVDVRTRNESVYENDQHPYAKYIPYVYEQCEEVATMVGNCLSRNRFPLVFSGDHSSAMGTISGIKSQFPEKTLGVIWIDAHADIHSPYTTPSGNMHGMPLGAMLAEDNLKCAINEPDEETKTYWNKLKNLKFPGPKIQPEQLVYFGVRDTEYPEDSLIAGLGIRNFMVAEVRERGIEVCIQEALQRLSECDILYLSFDVDSMDSELISDGTGTPVPRGFFPHEISTLLRGLSDSGKVHCLEIVEVNPLLDSQGNKMAEVTFDILEKHFKDQGE
ncbi:arginase [Sphingobacterium nematocida]|uniref:Arginase n=1 Tax=Sphingobacterium nematocida TaxID=1513896 RepID=A0A1T5GAE6_9SPHI|nr:arginase [Sphingobacterium nematocida]SKC05365.1 arginase [Sphingobacterium nematocida]